jgi:hypothetical protein
MLPVTGYQPPQGIGMPPLCACCSAVLSNFACHTRWPSPPACVKRPTASRRVRGSHVSGVPKSDRHRGAAGCSPTHATHFRLVEMDYGVEDFQPELGGDLDLPVKQVPAIAAFFGWVSDHGMPERSSGFVASFKRVNDTLKLILVLTGEERARSSSARLPADEIRRRASLQLSGYIAQVLF